MNLVQKFFFALVLLSFTGLVACKDDDDKVDPCNSFNFNAEIEAELNAYTTAATNYGANPTTENCNAFKAAGIAYVDALEDLRTCALATGFNQAEYQQNIDAARASFESFSC